LLVPVRSKASVRILIQGKPAEVLLNCGGVPEILVSVLVTKLN
jgi:hypothetical protein